jgi:hypothetical protein
MYSVVRFCWVIEGLALTELNTELHSYFFLFSEKFNVFDPDLLMQIYRSTVI